MKRMQLQDTGATFKRFSLHPSRRVRVHAGILDQFKRLGAPQVTECPRNPELFSLLQKRGLPPQHVQLQDTKTAGLGLFAAQQRKKNQVIVSIPENVLITVQRARQLSSLSTRLHESIPDWTVLAAFLAEMKACKEDASGEGCESEVYREWRGYIDVLPETVGCALEFTPENMSSLRGSPMQAEAQSIRKSAETSWAELSPIVAAAVAAGEVPEDRITEPRFRWGLCIILSRLVRLDAESKTVGYEALVPWADFMNHQPSARTHLEWDKYSQCVTLTSDRLYERGEQVFISYGDKPSSQLLLSYGFIPKPGTNEFDEYPVTITVDRKDPLRAEKAKLLDRYGLSSSETFPVRWAGMPTAMLPYVGFCSSRATDSSELTRLAEIIFTSTDGILPILDGVDLELLAVETLLPMFEAAARAYRFGDDDTALSERLSASLTPGAVQLSDQEYVKCAVAAVKIREQMVIMKSIRWLQAVMKANKSNEPLKKWNTPKW